MELSNNDVADVVISSVGALVLFELWKAYENNAPTLSELRDAPANDLAMRQKMLDADLGIGVIAIGVGIIFSLKTNDPLILLSIIVVLGGLSWWRHEVLEAHPIY